MKELPPRTGPAGLVARDRTREIGLKIAIDAPVPRERGRLS